LGLIQVSNQLSPKLSTIWQRLCWAFLEANGPIFIEKKLQQWKQLDEIYYQRQTVMKRAPLLRIIGSIFLRHLSFGVIQRLHLAVFYLFAGNFYSIWKRLTGIKYVSIRPHTDAKVKGLIYILKSEYCELSKVILSITPNLDQHSLQNNWRFLFNSIHIKCWIGYTQRYPKNYRFKD
jgi:hypothetical protein